MDIIFYFQGDLQKHMSDAGLDLEGSSPMIKEIGFFSMTRGQDLGMSDNECEQKYVV